MTKEDFQHYYDKGEYPGSIFYEYYVENCEPDKVLDLITFNRFFPTFRNMVDNGNSFLKKVIDFYIDKFSIKEGHDTVLLSKDGKLLKQLPRTFDYVKKD